MYLCIMCHAASHFCCYFSSVCSRCRADLLLLFVRVVGQLWIHVDIFLCLILLQVMVGDKVVLNPVNSGQPLHASSSLLIDQPNCQEVLCLFCADIGLEISPKRLY